jgi:hypothetical protein
MLDYPNAAPQPGDALAAERDGSWGHLADHWQEIDAEKPIRIEFGERCEQPLGQDTWHATVNGVECHLHIDVVTDIFQLADSLTYER